MRRLRLMADYGCWPLWGMDGDDIGNIDPATLPLTPETRERLDRWAQSFDAMLDLDDPASSRFASPGDVARFEAEGRALWAALRLELGEGCEVHYFSESGQCLLAPDETQR